jgi:hypothetical protein
MVYIKQFQFQYPSKDQSIFSVSSVAHCTRKERALTGLKQYGLFARTEFYQFVFMQNGQPVLLMDHNKAHVGELDVPCTLLPCVKRASCLKFFA